MVYELVYILFFESDSRGLYFVFVVDKLDFFLCVRVYVNKDSKYELC